MTVENIIREAMVYVLSSIFTIEVAGEDELEK
jgi:hypothetical protein